MDEIIIDEKRYVSSKRAAKMTGYAKDYVGQLCREGRVPARLVGRSWYVLESAIQDHRFGAVPEDPEPAKKRTHETEVGNRIESTWESPKYEAVSQAILPSINRLSRSEHPEEEVASPEEAKTVVEHLQQSWKGWFERASVEDTDQIEEEIGEDKSVSKEIEQQAEPLVDDSLGADEEVAVPIHTVYDLPPQDLLPNKKAIEGEKGEQRSKEETAQQTTHNHRNRLVLNAILYTTAVCCAVVSVISAGVLDSYASSLARVTFISGISIHIK